MTELERLDGYLSSDDSPEESFLLSDLDGFLHGIACTPVMVPAREWMPLVLGGSVEGVPDWVIEVIASRYADICEGLTSKPSEINPIFWQAKEGHSIAMDWCEGFMDAVKLRGEEWKALVSTEEGAKLMMPILVHLIDENGNSQFEIPQEELDETLDQAAEAILTVVPAIFTLTPRHSVH